LPHAPSPADCHPLVVDDDADYVFLLKRGLERAGVPKLQIAHAADGEAAVRLLAARPKPPSFVVLDHHMPGRTGLQVLEWMRGAGPLRALPVFMLTSANEPALVERAFQLGVGAYFIKPVQLRELEEILGRMMGHWMGVASPGVPAGSLTPERPWAS